MKELPCSTKRLDFRVARMTTQNGGPVYNKRPQKECPQFVLSCYIYIDVQIKRLLLFLKYGTTKNLESKGLR